MDRNKILDKVWDATAIIFCVCIISLLGHICMIFYNEIKRSDNQVIQQEMETLKQQRDTLLETNIMLLKMRNELQMEIKHPEYFEEKE